MNLDGSGLEQITHDDVFDAFPMFSPDGKKIVFSSNRNNGGGRDTNVIIYVYAKVFFYIYIVAIDFNIIGLSNK